MTRRASSSRTISSYDTAIDRPSVVPFTSFCVLLLIAASLSQADLTAQAINGVLLENGTNRPIDLGLIMLFTTDGDSVASALPDSNGRFRVEPPEPGAFLLSVTSLGYTPTVASSVFTLTQGGTISLEFRIQPQAIQLGGITVEASASLSR